MYNIDINKTYIYCDVSYSTHKPIFYVKNDVEDDKIV